MRIIAGRFKGTRLPAPRGKAVRPTTEKVREAVFDSLGPIVQGSRVLELFAGTGAFGLEALSRDAEFVVFVEKDKRLTGTLAETINFLKLQDRSLILAMSVAQALERLAANGERFSIISLDPPYGTDLIERVVNDPSFKLLLDIEGIVIIERDVHVSEPEYPDFFRRHFRRQYGGTLVEMFSLHAISVEL